MVKINTKKLGLNKPVFVKVTVKKIKLADMMMNKLLKLGIEQDRTELLKERDISNEDFVNNAIKMNNMEIEFADSAFDFLQKALNLSNKERDLAEDNLTFEELGNYINYVIMRIKGQSEEDIKAMMNSEVKKDKDPKKELDA
ncbi:phage tail tube assembly chaperone [Ligilactobacillus salivarius]|uniref:phage tail tube assembly chaperone n=1 Tax=Ligilactobacillus salivarius TaxID=1624 RepID=UPI00177FF5D0|nr:phage tail tube assembly chaperone [Ligilactobacillus salivarius]